MVPTHNPAAATAAPVFAEREIEGGAPKSAIGIGLADSGGDLPARHRRSREAGRGGAAAGAEAAAGARRERQPAGSGEIGGCAAFRQFGQHRSNAARLERLLERPQEVERDGSRAGSADAASAGRTDRARGHKAAPASSAAKSVWIQSAGRPSAAARAASARAKPVMAPDCWGVGFAGASSCKAPRARPPCSAASTSGRPRLNRPAASPKEAALLGSRSATACRRWQSASPGATEAMLAPCSLFVLIDSPAQVRSQ